MPVKSNKPCSKAGCKEYAIKYGYCANHQDSKSITDKARGNANERGYGHEWRKAREQFLSINPLCVQCKKINRISAAKVVDHIKAHKGNKQLFWDKSNWQALCVSCHNRKTASKDMGSWSVSSQ